MTRRSILLTPALWPWTGAFTAKAGATGKREAFLRLIDRPRVPLSPAERKVEGAGSLERLHFSFGSDGSQRVPGLLVKPHRSGQRLPAVVVLHGTGGNKEGQVPLLERLAGRGFAAIAIDGRYHGERTRSGRGSGEYVDAILRAWRGSGEKPFLYDTVWDILRLLDYLATRPDIDSRRIGMTGFSKGGMELYLAAAADERIAAVIPCIGVQSFRWALDHNAWQSRVGTFQAAVDHAARDAGRSVDSAFLRTFYDKVAPGVYGEFDGPAMLPLIAPRPLLVINGDSDARTPLPGLRECLDAAGRAYATLGAGEKFSSILQPRTGHRVNAESLDQAIAWFERWLGPGEGGRRATG
ncbi:MAG: alpha/beta hydrolase [Acidobacteria bacterium]|nr:alpha/beta hydrolase [Acidobacteriota bacterium]